MNNVIGIIIALLVIVGGGWYFLSEKEGQSNQASDTSANAQIDVVVNGLESEDEVMMKKEEAEDAMMKKDGDAMEKHEGDAMEKMEKEEDVMIKEEPVSQGPGSFSSYSSNAVASADGDVVIGFFADWCPSCRALKSDISANLGDIPSGLTILDANYDSETDLKKKYGVTTQHTLVQVDKDGNLVTSWRGGNTLDSIVTRVQ